MASFSRRSSSIPTCGWRIRAGAPASALTSCRAHSRRNGSLASDSSPTSCAMRGSSTSVPTDARNAGDHASDRPLPVGVQVALGLVEEHRPQPVGARPDGRRQRGRQPVRGEHVEHPALDERRAASSASSSCRMPVGHDLAARPRRRRRGPGGGQAQQVLRGGRVEPEHAGQRLQHLRRRVAVAALLQPQVVVGADARERRDLLAAQARRAPHARDAAAPHPRGRTSSRRARRYSPSAFDLVTAPLYGAGRPRILVPRVPG